LSWQSWISLSSSMSRRLAISFMLWQPL
jgi:hypothetical protein